jgi:aminopeptidase S
VDGGLTSIRSPAINLPSLSAGQALTLSFRYYLAHLNNSSSADYLRVKVVGATTTTVLQELGANNDDDASWASFSGNISAYAGQTVYLLVECADASGASLVEAAIDDVRIVAQ